MMAQYFFWGWGNLKNWRKTMNPIVRNSLAVIGGFVLGSIVNMSLVMVSGSVIPLPDGVDNTTVEGLQASIHLFESRHFIFPFLAHALGTLVGAFVAAKLATSRKLAMAAVIGVLFLAAGTANVFMLPAPVWFNVVDLVGAYLPMAWIGALLATKGR